MNTIHFFAALALAAATFSCGHKLTPEEEAAIQLKAEQEAENNKAEESEDDSFAWSYEEGVNEMTSKTYYMANILSPDVVNMDVPYEGGSYLSILVNQSGDTPDAAVFISKGQLFTEYGKEYIMVRFDNEEAVFFKVSKSPDGNAKMLIIDDAAGFVSKLKTAEKVAVQCQFYNNGTHVFKFATEGFTWNH